MCTTHALGLALFANVVLLLVGLAYILSYTLSWNAYMIKLMLVAVAAVLCVPYFYRDAGANSLNVAGVAVCLFYLLITLDEELTIRDGKAYAGPNPLITCLLTNLPLILSAHAIQLGVAGHARDLWAVGSFGVCGGLLGLMLQVSRVLACLVVLVDALTPAFGRPEVLLDELVAAHQHPL